MVVEEACMSKVSQRKRRALLAAWDAGFTLERKLQLKFNRLRFAGTIQDPFREGDVTAEKHRPDMRRRRSGPLGRPG